MILRTRGDVYRELAKRYQYTPQQIADMTRAQQYMMLQDQDSDPYGKYINFATRDEYQHWLANR